MDFNYGVFYCETTQFTDATDYSSWAPSCKVWTESILIMKYFKKGKTVYRFFLAMVYMSIKLSVDAIIYNNYPYNYYPHAY